MVRAGGRDVFSPPPVAACEYIHKALLKVSAHLRSVAENDYQFQWSDDWPSFVQ